MLLALAILGATSHRARAVQPDEMLSDPSLETRARTISEGLRCLVCQNQSIDDSNAPLAHDLRVLVRERLKAGDTNDQVREFLVARYGDFVLLKPPFNTGTALLWLTPLLLLGLGGYSAYRYVSSRRPEDELQGRQPLSSDETRRLNEILDRSE
ncbi:MAG: cytochrome c-type biogenesis protein CcmH [Hyphomicrobiaceae bacterium]